jgi:hypothetical protein
MIVQAIEQEDLEVIVVDGLGMGVDAVKTKDEMNDEEKRREGVCVTCKSLRRRLNGNATENWWW